MSIDLKQVYIRNQEELAAREARLRRFWAGEDLGRPPVSFVPTQFPTRHQFGDEEALLENGARFMERAFQLPGDAVPTFCPAKSTISLASAFGGKLVPENNGTHLWIEPVLKSLADIEHLEPPAALSGLVRTEFDLCRKFRDRSGGLAYVAPPDTQGPVNIAALLMDQTELIVGMYTEPELVHKLLKMCADLFTGVQAAYDAEFGDRFSPISWPYIWFPKEMGTSLTQDSIPFLSPETYREFELPLVKEIARRRGGVWIHCCGTFEYALDAIAEIPNLRGIDHAYPESRAEFILEKLGNRIVLKPGVSIRGEAEFPNYGDYVQYIKPRLPKGARIWHIVPDMAGVTSAMLEQLELPELKRQYERTPPYAP